MVTAALRILSSAVVALSHAPLASSAALHPLHTTMTEISFDPARRTVRATIRIFADDFATVVARRAGDVRGAAWDSAAVRYTTSAFVLADGSGRVVSMHSCGIRRAADLYFVCLEGASVNTLDALTVRSLLLAELYSDQINIVQADVRGARKSLMFTRSDRAKPLG